jgi:hypothetical protein
MELGVEAKPVALFLDGPGLVSAEEVEPISSALRVLLLGREAVVTEGLLSLDELGVLERPRLMCACGRAGASLKMLV